mmetsp:Transcript_23323/g.59785  ORF Transcript_23323/g.59785 Transcript_23323/m.59785 type:complete len:222 (-) Transcript_23323:137-802(-)
MPPSPHPTLLTKLVSMLWLMTATHSCGLAEHNDAPTSRLVTCHVAYRLRSPGLTAAGRRVVRVCDASLVCGCLTCSMQAEGHLQDRLGDLPAPPGGHGGGPRRLHRPEPVLQCLHGPAHVRQAELAALSLLEAGTQDRAVLPAHPRRSGCRQVHGRPVQGQEGAHRGACQQGSNPRRQRQGRRCRQGGSRGPRRRAGGADGLSRLLLGKQGELHGLRLLGS